MQTLSKWRDGEIELETIGNKSCSEAAGILTAWHHTTSNKTTQM